MFHVEIIKFMLLLGFPVFNTNKSSKMPKRKGSRCVEILGACPFITLEVVLTIKHKGLSINVVNKLSPLRRGDSYGLFNTILTEALPTRIKSGPPYSEEGINISQDIIRAGPRNRQSVEQSVRRMPKRESVKRSKKERRHRRRTTTNA